MECVRFSHHASFPLLNNTVRRREKPEVSGQTSGSLVGSFGLGKLSCSEQSCCWAGCFPACVLSWNHITYCSGLGLDGSFFKETICLKKNADLLKPVLLCGKELVSTRFSLGEFLGFGTEFFSQNRDTGQTSGRLGFSPMYTNPKRGPESRFLTCQICMS